jgi:hypothetical protein
MAENPLEPKRATMVGKAEARKIERDKLAADYDAAYKAANGKSLVRPTRHENGWIYVVDQMGATPHRPSKIKSMTANLLARAAEQDTQSTPAQK